MDPAESLWGQQDRRDHKTRDQLLTRVRAEFEELPCLRLTGGQARRLFGLRSDICDRVLGRLIGDGVLSCDQDGRYRRHDDDVAMRAGGMDLGSGRPRLRAS